MIRRPPRSTQSRSSAASDVYKRQVMDCLCSRLLHESPTVEESSHGHRGLLVLAGAAGLGVAVAIALTVRRHIIGKTATKRLPRSASHESSGLEALKSGAVSYTHLRAHETRHDLVCR